MKETNNDRDISRDEVLNVIKGISKAVDKMVHDFGFSMSVMNQISLLLNDSPPDMKLVRTMLDHFFGIEVPEPDEEDSLSV